MTFSRYNPSGYSPGQKLPSAAFNHVDLNQSRALDAYGGGVYSTNGSALINITTPVQLDDLAATVASGKSIAMATGSNLNFATGTNLNLVSGSHAYLYGTFHADGGNIVLTSTSDITLASGSSLELASGADATFASGSALTMVNSDNATFSAAKTSYLYLVPTDWYGYSSNWSAAGLHYLEQGASPSHTNDVITMPVPLSPAATITSVRVYLEGSAGHGATPAGMPSVSLWDVTTDGSAGSVDSQSDTTTVGGSPDYEDPHNMEITGLSESMGSSTMYQIRIYGEGSTNSQAGLIVTCVRIGYSVSTWARI